MTMASPPRPAPRGALLPGLVVFLLLAWKLDFLCDDAFISFRYSKNLAAGEGLRFNLGLGAPVEGYSNFLWVVWLALFEKLGAEITVAARLSSLLAGALLITCVTRRAARGFGLGTAGSVATGLFLGTLPAVAVWATGGLATMPAALLIFAAYDRLLGDPEEPHGWQAGLLAAFAGLVRADGTVWIFMLLGAGVLVWWRSGKRPELMRALLQTAAVLITIVGLHVLWRYSYYGDYLPNTARVKAGFSLHRLARGFDYVAAWLLALPAISAVLLLSLRKWRGETVHLWLPAMVVIGATLGYAVWVGGDFMPMGRFLFPAVPFVALLFASLWAPERRAPRLAGVVTVFCVVTSLFACFDLNLAPDALRSRFHFRQDRKWQSELAMRSAMNQRAMQWSEEGQLLARFTKPGETMIAGALGALSYYSELDFYDSYGLVTPSVIAAAKPLERSSPGHDVRVGPEFFLDRHPTYAGFLVAPKDAPLKLYPWLQELVEVERYPLDDPGSQNELRLLRFVRWE